MNLYSLARKLLFTLDAEQAHNLTFDLLEKLPWLAVPLAVRSRPEHACSVFGLQFKNRVGLAAGLDKDARLLHTWYGLGFGSVEVGTVTPRPQAGNDKPRLFRLPKDEALVNRMGFNNRGLVHVLLQLEAWRKYGKQDMVVGANIGKNKDTPNENAPDDYLKCLAALHPLADYFTVNVSSPNTPGLRALQDKEPLLALLSILQEFNQKQVFPRPMLLKIAPDMDEGQLDDVIQVVQAAGLSGVVATNTTVSRAGLQTDAATVAALGPGGLSGKPLHARSVQVVQHLASAGITVVGVGGIQDAESAQAHLAAGAKLVQVYTGFVYRGPELLKEILASLGNKT